MKKIFFLILFVNCLFAISEEELAQARQQAQEIINQNNQNQGESIYMNKDSTKNNFVNSSIRINPTEENPINQNYQNSFYQQNYDNQFLSQELSEEQITLLKAAARAKDLKSLQQKFFSKKYSGYENTIHFNYQANKTQKITTRMAMATTLIFSTKIDSFVLGDELGFKVEELSNLDNALAITPKLIGIDSSLTVFTNDKKIHTFYIYSTNYKSSKDPDLVVYIDDDNAKNQTQAEKQKEEEKYLIIKDGIAELKVKKDEIYDNYLQKALQRNKALLAEEIFNDKQYTYFKYDKERMPQIPSVFVVIDGQDSPIQSRVIGNYLIAETTAKKFTIRLGDSYICVERLNPDDKRIKNERAKQEIDKLFEEIKPKTKVEIKKYKGKDNAKTNL